MNKIFTHTWWMCLELFRQPSYFVATVAFPSLFYVIFAIPESKTIESSNTLLASFSCFAVFGVLFLQFGVGISQERSTSWYHYLRTLPLKTFHLTIARFITAYIFASLSVSFLVILSILFTKTELDFRNWLLFVFSLATLGLPFCFMGLCLGYFSNLKTALPIGNLIYLPLSFAGGLWKPPELLSENLNKISLYLPTRQYGEALWAIALNQSVPQRALYTLLFYLLFFAVVTYIGAKRDYTKRYQ